MSWQSANFNVREKLKYMMDTKALCDVMLTVGEEMVPFLGHSFLLAMYSEHFEHMLYPCNKDGTREIVLPDEDPDIFQIFIDYIYTDELKINTLEEAFTLLSLARKYRVPNMIRICFDFMRNKIDSNIIEALITTLEQGNNPSTSNSNAESSSFPFSNTEFNSTNTHIRADSIPVCDLNCSETSIPGLYHPNHPEPSKKEKDQSNSVNSQITADRNPIRHINLSEASTQGLYHPNHPEPPKNENGQSSSVFCHNSADCTAFCHSNSSEVSTSGKLYGIHFVRKKENDRNNSVYDHITAGNIPVCNTDCNENSDVLRENRSLLDVKLNEQRMADAHVLNHQKTQGKYPRHKYFMDISNFKENFPMAMLPEFVSEDSFDSIVPLFGAIVQWARLRNPQNDSQRILEKFHEALLQNELYVHPIRKLECIDTNEGCVGPHLSSVSLSPRLFKLHCECKKILVSSSDFPRINERFRSKCCDLWLHGATLCLKHKPEFINATLTVNVNVRNESNGAVSSSDILVYLDGRIRPYFLRLSRPVLIKQGDICVITAESQSKHNNGEFMYCSEACRLDWRLEKLETDNTPLDGHFNDMLVTFE